MSTKALPVGILDSPDTVVLTLDVVSEVHVEVLGSDFVNERSVWQVFQRALKEYETYTGYEFDASEYECQPDPASFRPTVIQSWDEWQELPNNRLQLKFVSERVRKRLFVSEKEPTIEPTPAVADQLNEFRSLLLVERKEREALAAEVAKKDKEVERLHKNVEEMAQEMVKEKAERIELSEAAETCNEIIKDLQDKVARLHDVQRRKIIYQARDKLMKAHGGKGKFHRWLSDRVSKSAREAFAVELGGEEILSILKKGDTSGDDVAHVVRPEEVPELAHAVLAISNVKERQKMNQVFLYVFDREPGEFF